MSWNDAPPTAQELQQIAPTAPASSNWASTPPTAQELAGTQPSGTPGQLEAFARGAGNGLTLGAEPAIAGAGAGVLAGLAPNASFDDIVKAYKAARESENTANKKASEAHPITSLAGNVVGGLPLAALTSGVGALGEAGTLTNALKTGAVLGAGAGAGGALSEGQSLPNVARNAISGAGTGMLTGGVLHGVTSGLGELADTDTVDKFKKAFGYGAKEGTDLVTKAGGEAAKNGISDAAEATGMGAYGINKSTGADVGAERAAKVAAGDTLNTENEVQGIKNIIEKLDNSNDPRAEEEMKFWQNYLDNTLKGKQKQVQFNEVNPEEVIPGTPSAQDKLLAQKAKLEAQENLLPKGATSDIQPSVDDNGNPFLNLVKQIPGEDSANPKVGIKTTLPETPGTPEQIIPGGLGPDKTQTVRMGGIDPNATTFEQANDMKNALTSFGGNGKSPSPFNTDISKNGAAQLGGGLNDSILQNPNGEGPLTSLAAATRNNKLSFSALKTLGFDDSDFITDPITGVKTLSIDAEQSLKNKLRQLGRGPDTSAGQNSSDRLNQAFDQLREIDPDKANTLQGQVQRASEVNNLYQQGQGNLFTKSGLFKTAPVQLGNRLGNTGVAQAAAKATTYAGNVVSNVVKGVSSSDMIQGAKSMMATGSPAAYKLASEIAKTATLQGTAKNAALFSLLQQPGYRDMMKQHIPGLSTDSDESSTPDTIPGDQQGQ